VELQNSVRPKSSWADEGLKADVAFIADLETHPTPPELFRTKVTLTVNEDDITRLHA
jgi:hypothetical protein